MQLAKIVEMPKQQRVPRRPKHSFAVKHCPTELQLVALAPVLPGETLKKLTIQSRAVAQGIRSPLTGWWLEYYCFYVTHRQLEQQVLLDMILDPTITVTTNGDSPRHQFWDELGGFNFAKAVETTVLKHFFRDPDDTNTYAVREDRPLVKVHQDNVLDSYTLQSAMPNGDISTIEDIGDLERFQQIYQYLRDTNFTKMTYEDFLESYGVKSKLVDQKRPELLRIIKEWQLPSNTVNPDDGSVTSALSYSIAGTADKDRYFTEPGFVAVYSVWRPKVFNRQLMPAVHHLNNALAWMPAVLNDTPETSLREFSVGQGPVITTDGNNQPYLLDMRDIYVHGDQIMDTGQAALDENAANRISMVSLPKGNQIHYLNGADFTKLLYAASPDLQVIWQDGIVQLDVLGTQQDIT